MTFAKSESAGSVQVHVIEVWAKVVLARLVTLAGGVLSAGSSGAVLAGLLTVVALTLPTVSIVLVPMVYSVSATSPVAVQDWTPLVTFCFQTPSRYTITFSKSESAGSVQVHVIEVWAKVVLARLVTLAGGVLSTGSSGAVLATSVTVVALTLPTVSIVLVPMVYSVSGESPVAVQDWTPLVTFCFQTPSR